jgi:hypothetical protein
MITPDSLNLLGLALDGSAALLLLTSAPIPQRNCYFKDPAESNTDYFRDRRTRKAHYIGFVMLASGFLFQLIAQVSR